MCANSEGSGVTARMRSLVCAFVGRLCDKYHNLVSWLVSDPAYCCFIDFMSSQPEPWRLSWSIMKYYRNIKPSTPTFHIKGSLDKQLG